MRRENPLGQALHVAGGEGQKTLPHARRRRRVGARRSSAVATRLRRMPGIGPVTAMAIETFAPAMANFRHGRDFAAWLGLVPRQHSSGGKQRLGRTSKMGQRDIRRLLIVGAMSVVFTNIPRPHVSLGQHLRLLCG